MDKRIPLLQDGLSHGASLCASLFFHALPLGGFFLWQGEIENRGITQHPPLTIDLIYENQNEAEDEAYIIKPKVEEKSKECEKIQLSPENIQCCVPQESSLKDTVEGEEKITLKPDSNNRKPCYPLRAREERIQGTVFLRITIQPSGQVAAAVPLEPRAHPLLEKAALEAVSHWTYVIPYSVRALVRDIPIIFELEE